MIATAKPFIGKEEKEAVLKVLESGMLAQGPKVKEFEEGFSGFCKVRHSIAVNNGTSALHTALHAAGIGPGDEIITTPFTFVASANCILMQNAKPVFADISSDTFNLDPESVRAKITPRTKAILFVDLFGQIADVKEFRKLADKHGLILIEDACQAHGASQDGRKAGSLGDIAAFSLYATKNMMCGEGGVVTTDNDEYAARARRFRHHGQGEQYEYLDIGYNYRLTDLQASIATEQLKRIERFNELRQRNARLLLEGLSRLEWVRLPKTRPGNIHSYHQFTIRVPAGIRDRLVAYMKENGVACGIFYPKPLHLHKHFRDMGNKEGDFPQSELAAKEVISIPVHPQVSEEDIQRMIRLIGDFDA